MFGYATDETPELMPLPSSSRTGWPAGLARHRKAGTVEWLRPGQQDAGLGRLRGDTGPRERRARLHPARRRAWTRETIRHFVATHVVPAALEGWYHDALNVLVNPTGLFVQGGPSADAA
jgi:S-adenosylmethionine synthetase